MEQFLQLVTVLIIFGFVLLITYLTTRWVGDYQKQQYQNKNVQIIEAARLSNNKYIQIIRVGKKYLAIVVCKDTVTVLTELTEDEVVVSSDGESVLKNKESFQKLLEQAKNIFPHK